ncbi:MAG: DUF4364 family protein [Oscillospiraceae bacterium]|nr:DUF4364 family protein [Oscillospiraceae bacterium]
MRDENLHKISELADRTVTDPVTANILLCYVMHKIAQELDADLLYDIAVTSGIINYFAFQDALQTMEETGAVTCRRKDGIQYYSLTAKGSDTADRLHHLTGKSYREHITKIAQNCVRRRKNEEQVKISYETLPQGCHLHVRIVDHELILLELTLFTPDEYQAKLLGDKILNHPSVVYHEILRAVMPEQGQ